MDEAGVDGCGRGLCLLPLTTRFQAVKTTRQRAGEFSQLPEPWSALSGLRIEGYEIRHGESVPSRALNEAPPDGLGYVDGPVLGIYLHGLFEQPPLLEALLGAASVRSLEQTFDELAEVVEERLDVGALLELVMRG